MFIPRVCMSIIHKSVCKLDLSHETEIQTMGDSSCCFSHRHSFTNITPVQRRSETVTLLGYSFEKYEIWAQDNFFQR